MTIEEMESDLIKKFGFEETEHTCCFVLHNESRTVKLWIDDKITIYLNQAKVFQLNCDEYGFNRAERYMADLLRVAA